MKKQFLSVILVSTLALSSLVNLVPNTNADEYDDKIAQKNNEVSNLKGQEAQAQKEVDAVERQIDATQEETAQLKSEVDALEKEQGKLSKDVAKLSTRIVERRQAIERQARSVQTDGTGANFLDVILDSNSITDAIARLQAVTKIVQANNELLVEQKKDKKDIDTKLDSIKKKAHDADQKAKTLKQKQNDLENQQAKLKEAKIALELTRATAEGDIAKLKADQKAAQEEAARIAAAQKAAQERAAAEQAAAERAAAEQAAAERAAAETTPAINNSGTFTGSVTITEMNYGGPFQMNTRTIPAAGLLFVYPKPGVGTNNNTYVKGQCTWYVKNVIGSAMGDNWGNGGDWAASAQAAGCMVSSTPAPGTIAVFPPGVAGAGGYGHVAVVNSVS